jgi:citronellol/citronellal dehydrogenase
MVSIFHPGLFRDRVILVTGGATGIGLASVRAFLELGAKVAICGRREEKLQAAREALAKEGFSVHTGVCDIRDPESVAAFVKGTIEALGPIDALVNNAGGQFPVPAEQLATKGWDAVIRNNLNGTFYMTREVALQSMIPRKKGRIVNVIANIFRGFPGMVHTGAARAGVDNITKTLAVEWARHNVQVNSVAPGIILSSGIAQYEEILIAEGRKRIPAHRLGTCEEVAQLIVFLASEATQYVTGETWYVDGGQHLWGQNWELDDDPWPTALDAIFQELAESDGGKKTGA